MPCRLNHPAIGARLRSRRLSQPQPSLGCGYGRSAVADQLRELLAEHGLRSSCEEGR